MINKTTLTAAAISLSLVSAAHAATVDPTIGTFGDISDVSSTAPGDGFGGSGIPTDATNYQTYTDGDGNELVLGLSITPRYGSAPTPVNNGAGTFTVQPGLATPSSSPFEGTLWNFSFYAELTLINVLNRMTIGEVGLEILYDLDSASGTQIADLGLMNAAGAPGSIVERSENLNFGYLSSGISGVVTPPSVNTFSPNFGEYSFLIRATNFTTASATGVGVIANVAPIPLPAALPLLLLGLGGLGLMRRRKNETA